MIRLAGICCSVVPSVLLALLIPSVSHGQSSADLIETAVADAVGHVITLGSEQGIPLGLSTISVYASVEMDDAAVQRVEQAAKRLGLKLGNHDSAFRCVNEVCATRDGTRAVVEFSEIKVSDGGPTSSIATALLYSYRGTGRLTSLGEEFRYRRLGSAWSLEAVELMWRM